ncbi:alpha/beta hydrolase [Erythrobacter sp. QSSC1-22B]|uniref:alpha/beta hydrolase n=1 Tax=Erythrobacter sp. QSSC1-22B TaxID=1860125 RepID=UPI00143BA67E|nr:alpha/beta hydrolase [Erythrobacter sp. QSSC1-22B]
MADLSGLDGASQEIVRHLEAHPFLDPLNMTPVQMRRAFDDYYASIDMDRAPVKTQDKDISGPGGKLSVRIYHPEVVRSSKLPVTVFCRGGGLVMGSLQSYDAICRRICQASEAIVVAVDYRQPPEHKHPAALDDCLAAVRWVRDNATSFGGDPNRVAIAGDSGGGMLAAATTQAMRDSGEAALDFQFLVYPAVGSLDPTKGSMVEFAFGYVFTPDQLDWLYMQYLEGPELRESPEVSPNLAKNLSGLPPALIVTAHYDIFCDEGEDYGRRLQSAGVPTQIRRFGEVIHGFLNMGGRVPAAAEACDMGGKALAKAFRKAGTSAS